MFGGKIIRDIKDKPNGGFPPIFLCKNIQDMDIAKKTDPPVRGFKEPKNAVLSMKDILEKRRNTNFNTQVEPISTSFIPL